ncbi:uncharacterized protein MONBRDRAFT_28562 [Monosiga brevicollis MX1]|uniref:PCIF1 WW domain-containing protein n=1 Tax=Monosiga brevicollis TaxID=81824 RepID=A9V8J3_MONBE|nr:uncharacterized protein MONBRDRAFT_28562 [Monosiga brevicollis MX1]EDQ86093.1 predicted protein [Monosiga brevicollis MX1]|eukprot:XP_001749018.1 hypothetical protein [Monosiga brevicollis MX1]
MASGMKAAVEVRIEGQEGREEGVLVANGVAVAGEAGEVERSSEEAAKGEATAACSQPAQVHQQTESEMNPTDDGEAGPSSKRARIQADDEVANVLKECDTARPFNYAFEQLEEQLPSQPTDLVWPFAQAGPVRMVVQPGQALHDDLLREYYHFKFTQRLVEEGARAFAQVRRRAKPSQCAYLATKVLERWVFAVVTDGTPADLPVAMRENRAALHKCHSELCAEHLPPRLADEVVNAIDACARSAQRRRDIQRERPFVLEYNLSELVIYFAASQPVALHRLRRLDWMVRGAGRHIPDDVPPAKHDQWQLAQVARCIFRYAAHLHTTAQHWGHPQEFYNFLARRLGLLREAFACPLNSRVLGYNDPAARFCSLYRDTDAPFGSLGSFFETDMLASGYGWVVHPPFTEDILNRLSAQCQSALQQAASQDRQLIVGIGWPNWTDMPSYHQLRDSPFKRSEVLQVKYNYHYERLNGTLVKPNFTNIYLILSAQPLNEDQQAAVREFETIVAHV